MGSRAQFWTRRLIWLLTAAALIVPMLWRIDLPMFASSPARRLYQAVESIPPDKILVISPSWEPGTYGENGLQTEVLIRHAFESNKRFAIFGWIYPVGPELAQNIAERLAKRYHKRYGVDWVNWGYRPGQADMIRGWSNNIRAIVKTDAYGTPIGKLPVMKGIYRAEDIGLMVEITPTGSIGTLVQYVYGIHQTPLGYAPTGVMAAEAYALLDSGQVVGLLRGLVGAAEYEQLLNYQGEAYRRMIPQSFAHALIILLVVLGNVLYLLSRGRGKPPPSPAGTGAQEDQ
jgi:hypothetical protein